MTDEEMYDLIESDIENDTIGWSVTIKEYTDEMLIKYYRAALPKWGSTDGFVVLTECELKRRVITPEYKLEFLLLFGDSNDE